MKLVKGDDGHLYYLNEKSHHMCLYWTNPMIEKLRREFPYRTNGDLAEDMGLNKHKVIRKAIELGLKKDPEWMHSMHRSIMMENCRPARPSKVFVNGKIAEYIKRETEEQRRQRLEKSIATRRLPINRTRESINKKIAMSKRTPEQIEQWKAKLRENRLRAIANGAVEKAKKTISQRTQAEKQAIILKCNATRRRNRAKGL